METILTPLGTRGWMPRDGRQTMCTLVQVGAHTFLLDCGTGVSRLLDPELQAQLQESPLTILFSHYHLDHLAGLAYLPGIFPERKRPVRLAGPREGFLSQGLRQACEQLTASPLSSRHYREFPFPVEIQEFGPEGFQVDGIPIAVALQDHPGGSVTLRIGDAVCYATDLAAATRELPLAKGVEVLIHEAWSPQAQAGPHSGLLEALDRTEKAGVSRLVPTHFSPWMDEAEIQSLATYSTATVKVLVPTEGFPFRF